MEAGWRSAPLYCHTETRAIRHKLLLLLRYSTASESAIEGKDVRGEEEEEEEGEMEAVQRHGDRRRFFRIALHSAFTLTISVRAREQERDGERGSKVIQWILHAIISLFPSMLE